MMSLRSRFLLVVIVASVIPLGLVGLWLTGSAKRSGEALLRDRLATALDETVRLVTRQWIRHRSDLLFVAESEAVQAILSKDGRGSPGTGDTAERLTPIDLAGDVPSIDPMVHEIQVVDPSGRVVARWGRNSSRWPSTGVGDRMLLQLALPVFDRRTGAGAGTLRIAMEPELLLPPSRIPAAVAGGIVTLTDVRGRALTAVPIQLPEGDADRFVWAGEEWMVLRRDLTDPAVRIVAAATLGPALAPFSQIARRGTLILVGVAILAVFATALLTRYLTRSLEGLSEAAVAVAGGDLARRVPVETDDELGRLADAFNRMTERLRRTLDRMAGRESLAAVGEFAAGLAHEVRNPLTSIQIDLQFVESELPDDSPLLEAQRKALSEIHRLDSTVRDALRVARSGVVEVRPIDLREPLQAAAAVARATFQQRGADLLVELPPEPVHIEGDPSALEQLFLNVLQNAGQAVEEGGRARARIDLEEAGARIIVRDDGPGMPPSVRERAFEPLFSTRAEGTGLGLPIAQRIAMAHGGALRIESEPGEGTRVELRLPLADAAEPIEGVHGRPE